MRTDAVLCDVYVICVCGMWYVCDVYVMCVWSVFYVCDVCVSVLWCIAITAWCLLNILFRIQTIKYSHKRKGKGREKKKVIECELSEGERPIYCAPPYHTTHIHILAHTFFTHSHISAHTHIPTSTQKIHTHTHAHIPTNPHTYHIHITHHRVSTHHYTQHNSRVGWVSRWLPFSPLRWGRPPRILCFCVKMMRMDNIITIYI